MIPQFLSREELLFSIRSQCLKVVSVSKSYHVGFFLLKEFYSFPLNVLSILRRYGFFTYPGADLIRLNVVLRRKILCVNVDYA